MTAKLLLELTLKEMGYDGLCLPEQECGCLIHDLMPCRSYCGDCEPAYEVQQPDGDYLMFTEKPEINN